MRPAPKKILLAITATATLALAPVAMSHHDEKQGPQAYRQSWFTLVGANFGPMVSMVKGEVPWQDNEMASYADQLSALATLDLMRGFVDGSEKGTTRAKPEIWQNKADFEAKLKDLKTAIKELQVVANEGIDHKAIADRVAATGNACKSCHDKYKAKDYLY